MARIKIEVDYKDAVAKIGTLTLAFDELGEANDKARSRVTRAVNKMSDAVKGSLKSLQRERAELKNIQASLSANNKSYRANQKAIEEVEARIRKLTDTRSKEEKVLDGSAAAIRKQIEALKQEQQNRKALNSTYREMQVEIDKLEAKLAELTNTSQVEVGSTAYFDQIIAKLEEERAQLATTSEEYKKYTARIADARQEQAKVTGVLIDATKAQQSHSHAAGAAGATVTEFSRVIQDSPYGLIGMANNIEQLTSQFADLTNKSGGLRGAFQGILKTLTGPNALVLAVSVVTAGLTFLSRRKQEAKKETEEFSEALLAESKMLDALNSLYEASSTTLAKRVGIMSALGQADKDYAKALEEVGINEEKRAELTEKYMAARAELNKAEEARNKFAEENKEKLEEETLAAEERLRIERELAAAREYLTTVSGAEFQIVASDINKMQHIIDMDNERLAIQQGLVDVINNVAEAEKGVNEALGQTDRDKFLEKEREFFAERELIRKMFGKEGSEAIKEEINFLNKELGEAVLKYGAESVKVSEARLAVQQKELEYEIALREEEQERLKKKIEKEKELMEMLRQLREDDLLSQDDYGMKALNFEEANAIKRAKELGASEEQINDIVFYYEEKRKLIREEANKDAASAVKKFEEERIAAFKAASEKVSEYIQNEIEAMKEQYEKGFEFVQQMTGLIDELGAISQNRYDRQINQIKSQAELVKANGELTKEQQAQQLAELQERENAVQVQRIKAERDFFTIKQGLMLSEMILRQKMAYNEQALLLKKTIMEQKAAAQQRVMMEQMAVRQKMILGELTLAEGNQQIASLALTGSKQVGEASMSIGKFMEQLGPFGIAAFALSIGSVIASIISARKKAQAEIAGLSGAGVKGGGASAPSIPPDFRVVGASGVNQLAEVINGKTNEPVKAYVVSDDVTSAQSLNRNIVEGASI